RRAWLGSTVRGPDRHVALRLTRPPGGGEIRPEATGSLVYPIPPRLFAPMPFFRVPGSPTRFPPLVLLVLLLGPGAPVAAQEAAVVRTDENLRAEPNGQIIGQALAGTRLEVEGRQDRWVEVTFDGWMWLPSVQSRSGGALTLAVGPAEGENLRDEPRGRI